MPFSHKACACDTSLSNVSKVHIALRWAESQRTMMSLLSLLKRQKPAPPTEVIQAVCDLYGLTLEDITSIRTEKLSALSPYLWVIALNERSSAVVVYEPGAKEQPVAAPWFEEKD
jgi:hypothetical protein